MAGKFRRASAQSPSEHSLPSSSVSASRNITPNSSPRLEALEQRLMLSGDLTGSAASLIEWMGNQTPAHAGQYILRLDGESGLGVDQVANAQEIVNASLDSGAESASRAPGDVDIQVVRQLGQDGLFLIETSESVSYDELVLYVSGLTGFLYVEPNFQLSALDTVPNDPSFSNLWGLHNTGQTGGTADADIDAIEAWDIHTGTGAVVVAVIDTGVDYNHVDLAANMWTNPGEIPGNGVDDDGNGYVDDVYGWDFVNNDSDPYDDHGHGTHCSGTIAGIGDNATGVAGVNWTGQIMALKFLDSGGGGWTSDAVLAVNYATMMRRDFGVDVVLTSNSWGGGGFSTALRDAIADSGAADMLFIAAAGNDASDNDSYPHYPSSYDLDNVISVAATDHNDNLAGFSNWGVVSVDLGAPGVDTYSTLPGDGYGYKSGTSMATPHVAGVAALAWDMNPGATYQEIRDAIFATADPLPSLAGKTVTGGRLNAFNMLLEMGLTVRSSSPAEGELVFTPPVDFVMNLTADYDTTSVDATDLEVNSIAADSFTITTLDTITFHFSVSPVTSDGLQTMFIAAGAITRASDGDPIKEWSADFRYDSLLMTVDSTVPPVGSAVTLPFSTLQVNFNEPYDPASIGTDDLTLSQGTVTAAAVVDTDTVEYTLDGIVLEEPVFVEMAAGAVDDAFGNPVAYFSGTYDVDIDTVPYPTPLGAKTPSGSLIYEGAPVTGMISTGGDMDSFTLDVDAGQSITVIMDPNVTLQPTIEVYDSSGSLLGSVAAAAPGEYAVLQTVPAAADDTYTVTVSGASGSTGLYTVRVVLNAAMEDEEYDGPPNDTLAEAQDIDGSFIPLTGVVERGAVLGSLPPATGVPVVGEDFESGSLDPAWSTYSSDTNGRIRVLNTYGAAGGTYSVWLDRTPDGTYTLNEAVWTVDLTGLTEANLNFWYAEYDDEEEWFSGDFTGHYNADGVAISDDGVTWHPVWNAANQSGGVWQEYTIDIAAAAASAGMTLGPDFQIKFQQYDDYALTTDGRGWDEIIITTTASANEDWYSFTLAAGEAATMAATSTGGGRTYVELYDGSGTLLAKGAVSDFVAPAAGTYYLRVTGSDDYNLLAMRNGAFDTGSNDDLENAQDITVTGNVLGNIGSGSFTPSGPGTPISGAVDIFGNPIDLGFAYDGSFVGPSIGARHNGVEYLRWGTYCATYSVAFNGNYYNNGSPDYSSAFSVNMEDISSGPLHAVRITGSVISNVEFERVVFWTEGEDHVLVTTTVTNNTGAPLSNVALIENHDPDPGEGYDTNNDVVVAGELVLAYNYMGAMGLGSPDARTVTSAEGFYVPNPFDVINSPEDPNGASGDIAINLAFDLGTLAPGESTTATFAFVFGADQSEVESTYADVVHLIQTGDEDFYSLMVNAGDSLTVSTATPGDGAGEFVNELDPAIELYDPDGNLVAGDDNSAPDGRNAYLTYTAGMTGAYTVRVYAAADSSGEYVLDVTGYTGALPAFEVVETDPPDGAHMGAEPMQITVDFSDSVLSSTLDASDLTVDAVAATDVTVLDHDTAVFDLTGGLSDGVHVVQIAAGAILDLQGQPVGAYTGQFEIDVTSPTVVSSSIQEGDAEPAGDLTYVVRFNEPLDTTYLDASDVSLVASSTGSYAPTLFDYDPVTSTLTLEYSSLPEDAYTLTLYSGDYALQDLIGHDLDGEPLAWPIPPNSSGDGVEGGDFYVNFSTDHVSTPFPTPLEAVPPQGSLIYEMSMSGWISYVGDFDCFTLDVEAGQSISFAVDPSPTYQPTIWLFDATGLVDYASSPAAGTDVVLQSIPVTTGGTHTAMLGGTGLGSYTIRVVLNAAVEDEVYDGPPNDTLAEAQDIDGSFIALTGIAQRGAVLGQADGIRFSASLTRNQVYYPQTLTYAFDVSGWGTPIGDATLHVSALADLGDTSEYITLVAEGLLNQSLFETGGGEGVPCETDLTIPLATLLQLIADGTVNFTATPSSAVDNFEPPTTYLTLELSYRVAGTSDFYSFTLGAGESAGVYVESQAGGELAPTELYDASGALLTIAAPGADNVSQAITDFTASLAGKYYLRVTGDEGYTLVVTRDAAFDLEPNDDIDEAQDITPTGSILGYVRAPSYSGSATAIRVAVHHDGGGGAAVDQLNDDTYFDFDAVRVSGSEIDTVLELMQFDVVVIGDQYAKHELEGLAPALREWVEGGGGVVGTGWLIWSAGTATGTPVLDIDAIMPVDTACYYNYSSSGTIEIVDDTHPVTDGIIDFYCNSYVEYPSTGLASGNVLGVMSSMPVVAVIEPGGGRSAYIGPTYMDGTTIFTTGMADRLYEQAVAWAAHGGANGQDNYSVSVTTGDNLTISTATPSDGAGEFVNELDPAIELYDPDGNLVASDDNSAPDGRNAYLTYTAGMTGAYTVRVYAVADSAGEYVLDVTGYTGSLPAFEVAETDPPDGAHLGVEPTQIMVDFSDSVLLSTLEASDLTVDAVAAAGVTVLDHDTAVFDLPGGLSSEGVHVVEIAAGAILDLQGQPLAAYTGQFEIDVTPPTVISSSIQEGDVVPTGDLTYVVQFSEPLDTTTLDAWDVSLVGYLTGYYSPTLFDYDLATSTLTLEYASLSTEDYYTLTLFSGDYAFQDLIGHDLDGEPLAWPIPPNSSGDGVEGGDFFVSFSTDYITSPFPTPLDSVDPLGSLIYDSSTFGFISFTGDTDTLTLDLDAGQTITVVVDPDSALQPTIELLDPSGTPIGTATGAVGEDTVLQTAYAADAGTYQIIIAGEYFTASSGLRVGLLTDGLPTYSEDEILSYLSADPRVGSAVLYDANVAVPDLATLLAETDTILFTTDSYQDNSNDIILGDLLADYVDAGGGLVMATFAWHAQSSIGIGGRIMTTGYSPFITDNDQGYGGDLDPAASDMTHPALADVTSFYSEYDSDDVTLDVGATAIAYYTDGDLLLAENASHRILGLSAYPRSTTLGGDYSQLVVNSLFYVARGQGPSPTPTGAYTIQVILNAAAEDEEHDGPPNDTLADAQDIDASFITLSGDAQRGAVVGVLPSTTVVPAHTEDFESGSLGPAWTTYSSNTNGRVRVLDTYPAAGGTYAVWMDTGSYGFTLNEAIWTVDLSAGLTETTLIFSHAEYDDPEEWFSGDFTGHYNADGVAISDDGLNWHPVWDAADQSIGVWQEYTIDLAAEAASAGMTLGPNFQIKFQQYDDYPLTTDGRGWDEITITMPAVTDDWYCFGLESHELSTLAVTSTTGHEVHLEIYDDDGVLLAAGTADAHNVSEAIAVFDAPDAGMYYVRVSGFGGYSLLVTRSGAFDLESNDDANAAQDITATGVTLGHIGASLGRLFIYDASANQIREIDPLTGTILHSFASPVGESSGPDFGLATTGSTLLAGGSYYDPIYELDPNTGTTIRTITNPSIDISGMAFLDGEIYLQTDSNTNQITVIDYATGAVNRTLTTTYSIWEGLAATSEILIGMADTWVYEIDPLTGSMVEIGNVSTYGEGIGVIGEELYVGAYSEVVVFDLATLTEQRRLTGLNDMEAVGADGSGSGSDYYAFVVDAGDDLTIMTLTPAGDVGQFVNELDPAIELYDPFGNLVASDDDGAPDGRNALLTHLATINGVYTVRIYATDGDGEYVLNVTGHSGGIPPKVTGMEVRGTSWSAGFINYLGAIGVGSWGYAIPTGSSDQLDPLPWLNVDQIQVTFDEDVTVDVDDLTLYGVEDATYSFCQFDYDPATFTATWTISHTLDEPEKLLLALSDDVRDVNNNALDGDWIDGESTYSSGDDRAGGSFLFRFNVLPGDVDQSGFVNIFDTIKTRNRQFTSIGHPNYSVFNDVDANGAINIFDTIKIRNRQFTTLPEGEPGGLDILGASAGATESQAVLSAAASSDNSEPIAIGNLAASEPATLTPVEESETSALTLPAVAIHPSAAGLKTGHAAVTPASWRSASSRNVGSTPAWKAGSVESSLVAAKMASPETPLAVTGEFRARPIFILAEDQRGDYQADDSPAGLLKEPLDESLDIVDLVGMLGPGL